MPRRVTISQYATEAVGRLLAERFGDDHPRHIVELVPVRSDPGSIYLACGCGAELRIDHAFAKRLNEPGLEPPPALVSVLTALEQAKGISATQQRVRDDEKAALKVAERSLQQLLVNVGVSVGGIYSTDSLRTTWRELPKHISDRISTLADSAKEMKENCNEVLLIVREIAVANALMQIEAPIGCKLEVARQLVLDPELRDAYDAATMTKEPGAAKKFILDQVSALASEAAFKEEDDQEPPKRRMSEELRIRLADLHRKEGY